MTAICITKYTNGQSGSQGYTRRRQRVHTTTKKKTKHKTQHTMCWTPLWANNMYIWPRAFLNCYY